MNGTAGRQSTITKAGLQQLIDELRRAGYEVLGPVIRDSAIVYDTIVAVEELPAGWTDEQAPGHYRLRRREDGALFGFVVGPHSWKAFLHPPKVRLWQVQREGRKLSWTAAAAEAPKRALLGVRSCELHAIAVQDRVLAHGEHGDAGYQAHRRNLFLVAVQCTLAGGTCFCASMNTGPRATSGFDLALTEVIEPERHYFVVEAGTEAGASVLAQIDHRPASPQEQAAATHRMEQARLQMGRHMDTTGIRDLLYRNYESPVWEAVAARCLTCANCTMVCPTCFCTTTEDVTDLSGQIAERWQKWESCFTLEFSYVHGGSIRASAASRYRQWLVHKLAAWIDQFGESGCVGCGRCISWCPVGIDLTEEIANIREKEPTAGHATR